MPPETNTYNFSTKFCFTKASLSAASASFLANSDKAQLDCYDTKCVGLIAVLYRGGRINFRARLILHKQRLSLALGDYSPQFPVEQARLACATARLQASQGIDPRAPSRIGLTFGLVWSDHYYPAEKARKRSIKDDVQKAERWLLREFGHMPLTAIKSSHIVAFLDMLLEREHLSPRLSTVTSLCSRRYFAMPSRTIFSRRVLPSTSVRFRRQTFVPACSARTSG
jgi:hypothetical protein